MVVTFDVETYLTQFRQIAEQKGFAYEVIGKVDGYEIPALVKKAEGRPCVYLSSGMHGDEPAGVEAMLSLLANDVFCADIEWSICPMLNPTGLAAGKRENTDGFDLNRDYLTIKTEEVRAHINWLEKQPVPEMFISLHEDWESTGFYLYEIQKEVCKSHACNILKAAEAILPIEPNAIIDDHQVREPGWIFHEPTADFPNEWPEAIYMAEQGTRVSYTLETPSSLDKELRVKCHQRAVKEAIKCFLSDQIET